MNRESLPLLICLFIPIALMVVILFYYYGYDITLFLRKVPLIYYVIVFPIALGFSAGIIKLARPD